METPGLDELQQIAASSGVSALGVAKAEVFTSTLEDLRKRKAAGLSADMAFTYRNPERSTDPRRALPNAQSLLVGVRSYLREPGEAGIDGPAGTVARYAWEDHYTQLKIGLTAVAEHLKAGGWRARLLVDDNALVDREAAYRAGLGWYGKNANLLVPGAGSWFVIGSVVTDAKFTPSEPVADGCGSCDRCLTSCPTQAIVTPGVIDARRCLAWLVQAKGSFPAEHREALGTRIYGCDDCQEVCPPNRRTGRQTVQISRGAHRPWVPLLEMLEADDEALLADYGVWYIPGREPRYLRRNALVALGNARPDDPRSGVAIRRYLADDDPMLRAHAVWAAKRLGIELPVAITGDPNPEVAAEVVRDVSPAR